MKKNLFLFAVLASLCGFSTQSFAQDIDLEEDPQQRAAEAAKWINQDNEGGVSYISSMITLNYTGGSSGQLPDYQSAVMWCEVYESRLKNNNKGMEYDQNACRLCISSLRRIGDDFKADQLQNVCFNPKSNQNKDRYLKELAFIGQHKFKNIQKLQISEDNEDEFGLTFISDRLVAIGKATNFKMISDHRDARTKKYARPKFMQYSSEKDIYVAEYREGSVFIPELVGGNVNTTHAETAPFFSQKRKEMYFSRTTTILLDRKKVKSSEKFKVVTRLYKAVFDRLSWRTLGECDIDVGSHSAMHPTLSPDASKLYFSSDMPNGHGGFDLYEVDIFEDGSFGKPVNLGGSINSPGNEVYPIVNNSGDLFFASDGLYGYGGFDIFVSYLEPEPFETGKRHYYRALNLGYPVNTFYDEFAFSCAPGGENCFFSSNRVKSQDNLTSARNRQMSSRKYGDIDLYSVHVTGDIFLQAAPIGSKLDELRYNSDGDKKAALMTTNPVTKSYVQSEEIRNQFIEPEKIEEPIEVEQPMESSEPEIPGYKLVPEESKFQANASNESILELSVVYFPFGQVKLSPNGRMLLGIVANVLAQDESINLEIQGHTDSIGNEDFNHSLSLKRSSVARDFLVSQGIDPNRLSIKGFGESKLAVPCYNGDCTPEEEAKNRRVEFDVQ